MSVKATDQPLQVLRNATIDQLVMNYGHEKISMEAFDRRLEQALDAKEHSQLLALTEDLELDVDQDYLDKKQATFGTEFSQNDEGHDVDHMVNILSGNKRQGQWTVAKEIRVLNILGGDEIDLTEAIFTSPVTQIKVRCILGGINIFVPEGIRVKTKMFNILGGFDDYAPSSNSPNCPTVIIEGLVFLGGIKIKTKTTFKQRLLEFGNSVRTFFGPDTSPIEKKADNVSPIREQS